MLERLVDRPSIRAGHRCGGRPRAARAARRAAAASRRATRAPSACALLGGLEAAAQRLVARGLRGRDRGRGARGERLQQPLVLLVEGAVATQAVEDDQEADRAVAEEHRRHERRACAQLAGAKRLSGSSWKRCEGRTSAPPRERLVEREARAATPRRLRPRPRRSRTRRRRASAISAARAPISARERLTTSSSTRSRSVSPPSARVISVVVSRPRIVRCELVAALPDFAVQPRVRDRDRRPVGEHDDRLLVVVGELAVVLLGQVEVSPGLAVRPRSGRRGRCHRRMRERKAVGLRVRADVGQAERLRLADQHAEHAAPARKVADRPVRLLVDPAVRKRSSRRAARRARRSRRNARPSTRARPRAAARTRPRVQLRISDRPTSSSRLRRYSSMEATLTCAIRPAGITARAARRATPGRG